tara:strand:+ start:701 stop:1147 length:447 start_codon:yes stop_codon:yes gene_type:complete
MAKIDKTDIENIQLISKETKIQNITSVRIKKGDYEIEISSGKVSNKNEIEKIHENKLKQQKNEISDESINQENIVKSPMVGVAYLSADPNSPAYVKVGQHVKQGDILLLIEAMKTFNEIKAPKSGVIKKIVVLNSQPVEFGDDLIIFE